MQMQHQHEIESMQMDKVKQSAKMDSDMRMMKHKENLTKKENVDGNNKGRVSSVERKPSN